MQETITIAEVAQLAIVGAVVSVVVQFVKASSMSSPLFLRVFAVALSLALGTVYWYFRDTALWTTFLSIVAFANTVFLFVIKPLEEAKFISK